MAAGSFSSSSSLCSGAVADSVRTIATDPLLGAGFCASSLMLALILSSVKPGLASI